MNSPSYNPLSSKFAFDPYGDKLPSEKEAMVQLYKEAGYRNVVLTKTKCRQCRQNPIAVKEFVDKFNYTLVNVFKNKNDKEYVPVHLLGSGERGDVFMLMCVEESMDEDEYEDCNCMAVKIQPDSAYARAEYQMQRIFAMYEIAQGLYK